MSRKLASSQLTNFKTYELYKSELLTLAENVFEFKNLPTYIDIAFLNRTLIRKGAIAFFKDEDLNEVIALPFTNAPTLDIYGRPIEIEVYGSNGYTKHLDRGEFVIMYDNNSRYPLYLNVLQMAERIGACVRVSDINIAQQKTPRIWKVPNGKEKTITDLLNNYDGNVETIATYDTLNIEDLTCVCEPAPYVADKIDDHLKNLWAEFFTLIGVASVNETKKERLIKDEMTASLGGNIASRFSRLTPRVKAVKEINKMFGTNIQVGYYDGVPPINTNILESEGNNNVTK